MLVPPNMKTVPIVHQINEGTEEPRKEDFEIHVFPYRDLSPVVSHLLPQFVIFNAGKKIAAMQFLPSLLRSFLQANAHVHKDLRVMVLLVGDIYRRWATIDPTYDWQENPPPAPRNSPSQSSKASTERRRTPKSPAENQRTPRRARMREGKGSGSGNEGQQQEVKGGGSGGQQQDNMERSATFLDTKSMKKLDRRSERRIFDATITHINSWRKGVVVLDVYDGEVRESDNVTEGNVGVAG